VGLLGTVAGNFLLVHFTASGVTASPGRIFFRLLLNGASIGKGASIACPGGVGGGPGAECAAIVARLPIAVGGLNTVSVEWSISAGSGSATITAATTPDQQHGTLIVEEVAV
jgi:hypothetical protein